MKKSSERRSMTYSMICYCRLGGVEGCKSPFDLCKRIEGACASNLALALDIWALHACFMTLAVLKENETLKALNEIYLQPFSKDLRGRVTKKEISERVLRFAYENHLDERTVYRRLQRARKLWLDIREQESKTYKKEGTL